MPKTVSGIRSMSEQVTVALNIIQAGNLRRLGETLGSQNQAARQVMNDYFEWYDLPDPVVQLLAQDAKSRKLAQRDYMIELLIHRYNDLLLQHHRKGK